MSSLSVDAAFPAKLQFLFQPARYKVAHGGRGSGKSWGFARALLIQAASRPLRVLCTREVQKSIKDSVHTLLADQIQALQLGAVFQVLETEIRGPRGSKFIFAGLSTETAESIKSYEGVDIVWVEEAQAVKKRSWDILTPTIRRPDSEIWVTFNPELDTDETWRRFVANPPPGAVVVPINWQDNPWFPPALEQERRHCKEASPDDYAWIWEGQCKAAIDGAIYATEITKAQAEGRVCILPADPLLKSHAVLDLGWNDAMTAVIVQRRASEVRVVDYVEVNQTRLDEFLHELKSRMPNRGTLYLPHDGFSKDWKTGKTGEEIAKALGWQVRQVPGLDVESGIKAARQVFPRVVFAREKAARLIECLKRYRRRINTQTAEPMAPVHDEFSHGADAFRYMALVADDLKNEEWGTYKFDDRGIL